MAKIHINDVVIHQNPAPFSNPFEFQITFDCNEELNEGLLYFFSELMFLIELLLACVRF